MPLLISPIDGSPMKQLQRFGIELDICPTSGGVWLDKGELEKLMALIKQAAEEENQRYQEPTRPQHYEQPRYEQPRYKDDYHHAPKQQHYDNHHYHKGPHKKKSALSQMMDIFDF